MKLYWKQLLLVMGCIAAALVWALPSIAGSRWVYQPLVDRLANERFRLTIERVDLGWLKPISLDNIQLGVYEPQESHGSETQLVTIDTIRFERSLLGFLWHRRSLGTVEVVSPNIDIRLLEDGNNLDRLISAIEASSKPPESQLPEEADQGQMVPPLMDAVIVLRGLHVTVTDQQAGQPVMVIPPFDATIAYKSLSAESQIVVEPTRLLDQVEITRELVQLGLSKAVPLLAQSADFDGRVSLESGRISIPLQRPLEATGDARLTLHQVRSIPTDPTILGAIDLLGRMFKLELPHELIFVDGSTVQVEVAEGLVRHEGVRAGLPRIDERLQFATSGSVGLVSRELDLKIELPVPLEQLARREAVKQLGVPSITLPIRGTLDRPELDLEALRQDSASLLWTMSSVLGDEAPLAGAVIGALGNVAEGQADQVIEAGLDLVQKLVQRRQERDRSANQSKATPEGDTEAPRRTGPLRETLRGILRGNRTSGNE